MIVCFQSLVGMGAARARPQVLPPQYRRACNEIPQVASPDSPPLLSAEGPSSGAPSLLRAGASF